MKRIVTAISALAILAGAAGSASAQPYHHGGPPPARVDTHDYWAGRHPGWNPGHRMDMGNWRQGQRVDYRRYHLRAPPRGYEWRQVDGNYVLAAAATGLIASIIAASH